MTILATGLEFTKLTPENSSKHYWCCVIGFSINAPLLNFYFILSYYLFFPKQIYLTYASVEGMEAHPKYAQLRTGGGGLTFYVYVRTYTISFHVFGSIFVLSFNCRNSTLPLFKKDAFIANGCFSLTRSIVVVMK